MKSLHENLLYIAGYIDAKSSITSDKDGTVVFRIQTTDEATLKLIAIILGGVVLEEKTPNGGRVKKGYRWKLTGTAAVKALRQLTPYLLVKRQLAKRYSR